MNILRSNDDQINDLSSKELGGKAYHLVQLEKNGFNVPSFVVLTSDFFKEIHTSIDIPNLGVEASREFIIEKLEEIQQAIVNYNFSKQEEEMILNEFEEYLGPQSLISVRSSGGAEDGESASFAGQHSTFLFVELSEVLEKIKLCLASAWSFGAISYRIEQGVSLNEFDFAVILQNMVFAEKSGIGFSMNPSGNLADVAIVAGYGVGEGVVSDEVESDSYLIDRQTKKVSKTIIPKKSELTYHEEKGLIKAKVADELMNQSALTDDELNTVIKALFRAEKMLGGIADIEFCFEGGVFYMLQARPVTRIDLKKVKLLDNTNIVESYPGISLPLTFSFARHAYDKAFQGASKAFWISKNALTKTDDMFHDLLGYHQGRIYYRLDNWYKMITLVFSSKKSIESWEKAVGLKRPTSDEVKLSFGNKLKVYTSTLWRVINYKRGNRRFFELFDENYNALRQRELKELDLSQLSETLDQTASAFFEFWYLTLINDLLTFKSFDWVQKGVKRRKLGSEDLANDLISGIHQSESELSIVEVLRLKEIIQKDSELIELFKEDSKEIWKALSNGEFGDFSENVRKHIDRFGDRTLAELKLENPSFRKEPWRFMDLLKSQLRSLNTLYEYQQKRKEQFERSNKLIAEHHQWWNPRSHFFKFAIRMAAYGTRNREDMRFCRTRIYGAVKDIYVEIGERFKELDLISHSQDIFYLQSDEVRAICNDPTVNQKSKVESRKFELEQDAQVDLPDRIIYTDLPPIFKAKTPTSRNDVNELEGIAVSKGVVQAEAMVISNPDYDLDASGKIIITEITDPGWVFLMSQATGLISQKGSLLSHTAIVGREMGIPVIVSVDDVTRKIQSGDIIEMDGQRGTIKIIQRINPH